MFDDKTSKRRDLDNALATMSNVLWNIQHRTCTWKEKIRAIEEIRKIVPLVIRYMMYFDNLGE